MDDIQMSFSDRVVRLKEVIEKTGLSRSSIYMRMREGDFPQSIQLGARSVGWLEKDIYQWISERVKLTRASSNEEKSL